MKATKSYLDALLKKFKISNIVRDYNMEGVCRHLKLNHSSVYQQFKGNRKFSIETDLKVKDYIGYDLIYTDIGFEIVTYCKDAIIEEYNVDCLKTALISIVDSDKECLPTHVTKRYAEHLTLHIDDISHIPKDNSHSLVLFNKNHYNKICKFIDSLDNDINRINIHCTAGVSRSGAVAIGIGIYKGNLDLILNTIYRNSISPNERILTYFVNCVNPLHYSLREIYQEIDTRRKINKTYKNDIELSCMNIGYIIKNSFMHFRNKQSAEYACKLINPKEKPKSIEVVIDINN